MGLQKLSFSLSLPVNGRREGFGQASGERKEKIGMGELHKFLDMK